MNNPNRLLVSREIKFVIATLSSPTMYLYKKPGEYEYKFYKSIGRALFTIEREVAQMLLDEYKQVTGDDIELVVLPVEIEYELVNESNI